MLVQPRVFRTTNGSERVIALPDSLGGFVQLWATDAGGSGAYLQASKVVPGAPPLRAVIRFDRASGASTVVLDLPTQQVPSPLGAQDLTARDRAVVYATWPPGPEVGRPTVWRAWPGRPPARVAELPLECIGGTLTMSADGRRFACAEWTRRPDLFLLEYFDRYRQ